MAKKGYLDGYVDNNYRKQKLPIEYQDSYDSFLNYLLKQKIDSIDTHVYASIALNELEIAFEKQKAPNEVIDKNFASYLKYLNKGKKFGEEKQKLRDRDYEKFSVASIWEVFTWFVVLLFFNNWINETYLIDFSVDVLIAIAALFIATKNFSIKLRIIKKYRFNSFVIRLDVLTILLCFAIKLLVRTNFDITFLILVISYLITKRKIKPQFEALI